MKANLSARCLPVSNESHGLQARFVTTDTRTCLKDCPWLPDGLLRMHVASNTPSLCHTSPAQLVPITGQSACLSRYICLLGVSPNAAVSQEICAVTFTGMERKCVRSEVGDCAAVCCVMSQAVCSVGWSAHDQIGSRAVGKTAF